MLFPDCSSGKTCGINAETIVVKYEATHCWVASPFIGLMSGGLAFPCGMIHKLPLSAEIDASLLSDNLDPEAGFSTFYLEQVHALRDLAKV